MTNHTGEQLLEMLENEPGLSTRQLARRLGLTIGQVAGRIRQARVPYERTPAIATPEATIVTEGNATIITAKNIMVSGLDELYALHKINIDEWREDWTIVNFWGNTVNPNTQVKAKLTPLYPEAIHPVVSPVEIQLGTPLKVAQLKRSFKRLLFVPDAHTGFERDPMTGKLTEYHNRAVLEVTVMIAAETQPDVIVFSGDWMDLAETSEKFLRSPQCSLVVQPTVIETAWWLAQFRLVCPNARIIYLEGNHEARIPKLMMKHLPWAYDLHNAGDLNGHPVLSIPSLLNLDALNIEWVGGYPNSKIILSPSLVVSHGETVRAGSGKTTKAMIKTQQYCEVFGHIHRIELSVQTVHDIDGSFHYVTVFSPGMTGWIDGRIPGGKSQYNWQNGCGIVDYTDDFVQPYPILITPNGEAMWKGKWYRAYGAKYIKSLIKKATDLNI